MRDINCVKSINTRSSEMTHASSVAVLEHYSKLLSVLDCKQSKRVNPHFMSPYLKLIKEKRFVT